MITNIVMTVDQTSGAFNDAEAIHVQMDDTDINQLGRKVFLRQIDKSGKKAISHLVFVDGKEALDDLIRVLQFIRAQKGWDSNER